jgi:HSP20 family protein
MSSHNPFEGIERLFERTSRQLREASRSWESEGPWSRWTGDAGAASMPIDLVAYDDRFVVAVDRPGFDREDVEVGVSGAALQIGAEREASVDEAGEGGDDGRYVRRERRRETTERSIRLPDAVDPTGVTARMTDGVLTVTLPRVEAASVHRIEVE